MKRFFFFFLFPVFSCAQQAGLTPVQIAERNKPATVMIQVTFKGTVHIIQPVVNDAEVTALAQQVKQDLTDQGKFTNDLFWNTYIMSFCKNIDKYMTRGTDTLTKQLNTSVIGSGFIISPDGYVVTNCHVVDENVDETKQTLAAQAFQKLIDEDIKTLETAMNRKLTNEESTALTDADSRYYIQTMDVGNITKEFSVVLGITGENGKIVPSVIAAELIVRGNPIPGKDVAILKLKEKKIYPTIRVGDDKAIRVGDQVYVLGYPGVATFHPMISQESVSEATLTRGIVSARKNMKDGWEVLQIDAAITHGNSGGPVMNDKGEVIGLATFGSPDLQRNQEIQGMNFIVPTTIANEFIYKTGVNPTMSSTSLSYEAAMNLLDNLRFKKALKKFEEVKEADAAFPFIDKYIADTKSNIAKGLDKEPANYTLYYYIGGAFLVILLLLLSLLRRKK